MTTFVLVHGAWGGSYSFRKVRPSLHGAGHEVFTPSLTGLGERAHLTGPQVDLSTHVRDVVNVVRYEDLRDIVLLGFSYGGMVVTGALAHIGDRVRELVYLDAFVPDDGESLSSITGRYAVPDEFGTSWQVPPLRREYDVADFLVERDNPQPRASLTEPVKLGTPLEEQPFGLTYIRATDGSDAPAFVAAAARARASSAWRYHEIDTNHFVAENRPQELTEVLLTLG
ncbi:alpha/beta hydrolase [Saccharopolyspora sp. K220]|uniref:alpha/beta fold hydrolase n=1 Tax=Saccharopolyspora soli TaxID=2926618 RepID=UPI001F5AB0BA|nr:alpha/beta fold hydrolase [Saccharopolyspora soli]MCI2423293.1 alpha/beta hydrolase [Saccharopolyspora soli]